MAAVARVCVIILGLVGHLHCWDPIRDCEDNTFGERYRVRHLPATDKCYYVRRTWSRFEDGFTWYKAQETCRQNGADLVSIHTPEESDFVLKLVKEESEDPSRFPHYWIGLNELDLKGYRWTDGSPGDFFKWLPGQPSDDHGAQLCVQSMMDPDGWKDENCGFYSTFVCKRERIPSLTTQAPPTVAPVPGYCPAGFTGYRNKCFRVYGDRPEDRLPWSEAQDACKALSNHTKRALLATTDTEVEQELVSLLISEKEYSAWLGLHRQRSGIWEWTDNTYKDQRHDNRWARERPRSSSAGGDCALVYSGRNSEAGRWSDEKCTDKHGYICQWLKDPDNIISTPPPPDPECPPGYAKYRTACYKFVQNAPQIWTGANAICRRDGAYLASIMDSNENLFLLALRSQEQSSVYIGLSDIEIRYHYHWADEWPVVFTNWDRWEPRARPGGGCIVMTDRGRWQEHRCRDKAPFLCKKCLVAPPRTQRPYYGRCPEGRKWRHFNRECYYLSEDERIKTWGEAVELCQNKTMPDSYGNTTAVLASIRDEYDNTFLRQYNKNTRSWIGLRRTPEGEYKWLDGTPFSYNNWDKDEPDMKDPGKECVIFNSDGKWQSEKCERRYNSAGYVCHVPKEILQVPTPAPTSSQNPSGGTSAALSTQTTLSYETSSVLNTGSVTTETTVPDNFTISSENASTVATDNITTETTVVGTTEAGVTTGLTSSSTIRTSTRRPSKSRGLSGGAIAGAVIGSLLGVALIIGIVVGIYICRRRPDLTSRIGARLPGRTEMPVIRLQDDPLISVK